MLTQLLIAGAAILTPQQVASAEKIIACSSDNYKLPPSEKYYTHPHEGMRDYSILSLPKYGISLSTLVPNDPVTPYNPYALEDVDKGTHIERYAKFISRFLDNDYHWEFLEDTEIDNMIMFNVQSVISTIITDETILSPGELFNAVNSLCIQIADNVNKDRKVTDRNITESDILLGLTTIFGKDMLGGSNYLLIKKYINIDETIKIFEILMRLPEKSIPKEKFIEYLDKFQKSNRKNIGPPNELFLVLGAVISVILLMKFTVKSHHIILYRSFLSGEALINYKTYLETHGFHQQTIKKKLRKSKRLRRFKREDINPDSLDTYTRKNPGTTIQNFTTYKELAPQIAYMESLPKEQMDSIRIYTTNYYKYINGISSFYKTNVHASLISIGTSYDNVIEVIKNIDTIFENIPPITHPLTTYRCYRTGILVSPKENKKIEDQFKSFQYISTTLSYEYALTWCTDYNTQTAFIDSTMIEIRIPKGVKILPIYTVSTLPDEKEVLLDRRGTLKRLLINPRKPTTTNYVFEYVPPDYNSPDLSKVKDNSKLVQDFLDGIRLPNPFA